MTVASTMRNLKALWLLLAEPRWLGGLGIHAKADWPAQFPCKADATLVRAICRKSNSRAKTEIGRGGNPNSIGIDGATPLLAALDCKNREGFTLLLDQGADPNQLYKGSQSLPWAAARTADSYFISELAKRGANLNGIPESADTSALLGAISLGFHTDQWDNYLIVLDSNVDVNRRYGPMPGITAGTTALGLGRFTIALDLLRRGYDLDLAQLYKFAEQRPVDRGPEFEAKEIFVQELRLILNERGIS